MRFRGELDNRAVPTIRGLLEAGASGGVGAEQRVKVGAAGPGIGVPRYAMRQLQRESIEELRITPSIMEMKMTDLM
jgi:hypothetical protein